jgi:K+-sensing histidine kinase KdpD
VSTVFSGTPPCALGHVLPSTTADLWSRFNRLGIGDDVVEGTGIGLSITRRLLDLMGGRIDVTSEVGRGSEFRVHLPLDLPSRASDEAGRGVGHDPEPPPGSA